MVSWAGFILRAPLADERQGYLQLPIFSQVPYILNIGPRNQNLHEGWLWLSMKKKTDLPCYGTAASKASQHFWTQDQGELQVVS